MGCVGTAGGEKAFTKCTSKVFSVKFCKFVSLKLLKNIYGYIFNRILEYGNGLCRRMDFKAEWRETREKPEFLSHLKNYQPFPKPDHVFSDLKLNLASPLFCA